VKGSGIFIVREFKILRVEVFRCLRVTALGSQKVMEFVS